MLFNLGHLRFILNWGPDLFTAEKNVSLQHLNEFQCTHRRLNSYTPMWCVLNLSLVHTPATAYLPIRISTGTTTPVGHRSPLLWVPIGRKVVSKSMSIYYLTQHPPWKGLKLFTSYLCHSSEFVWLKHFRSHPSPARGVPQGSTLGPLLFIIYLVPLCNRFHKYYVHFHFYMNGTQLYLRSQPLLFHSVPNREQMLVLLQLPTNEQQ